MLSALIGGNFMKALKEHSTNILLCVLEILVGILLLIDPIGFTSGIIITAGVVLLAVGLICVIKYFRAAPVEAALSQLLLKGLTALALGAFCVFRSQWFVVVFPMLTILYGVVILVVGFGKVQLCVDMLRIKKPRWYVAAISAALSVICGLVVLANPFASTVVLWAFTGVSLIVEAVLDAVSLVINNRENPITL